MWGSTYLAIAIAVQTLPPLLSAGLRFLLAGTMLAGWLVARHGRAALRIDRAQLGGAALVGMLLLAGGNGLVVLAQRTVPSGLTALVVASVPLWIVVFRLVSGDRIAASLIAGVLVGFAGVAILVVPRGASGEVDPIGLLMLVGATFSWALGTFSSPRLSTPRDPLASTTVQMLAGGALLVVIAGAIGEPERADPSSFSAASLVAMAYLVVFGSLVAFSAYTWLLRHAPVSVVATYAYVNPVVAVVLGALVLSEVVTPSMLLGAAIILAAVAFIVSRGAARSDREGDRRLAQGGHRSPRRSSPD
ncbi:MAG TPA: EamA family transporter [Candidatus Limnocylindria bacterium]|nr:EamA family transporter [Candidatus Limnocylindria bacterium]